MMYRLLAPEFAHRDERGSLLQLASKGYSQVNVLVSRRGVTRGGHYHERCREAFFVVSGNVHVTMERDGAVEEADFAEGSFFEFETFTAHEMYFPEDCVMVALYDTPVESEEGKDIVEKKIGGRGHGEGF